MNNKEKFSFYSVMCMFLICVILLFSSYFTSSSKYALVGEYGVYVEHIKNKETCIEILKLYNTDKVLCIEE